MRDEGQHTDARRSSHALEALDAGDVAMIGTAGFTTREDVLSLEPLRREGTPTEASPFFAQRIKQRQTTEGRLVDTQSVARGEVAEASLDAFIAQRHERRVKAEGERDAHELWQQSVDRYHARERERNRWAWVRHFDRMAANHKALAEDYARRADALIEKGDTAA